MEKFSKECLIQNFIVNTYSKLISGEEIPKVKLLFKDNDFELFETQNDKIFIYNGMAYISEDMIDNIKNNNYYNDDEYPIEVSNTSLFFDKLMEIANLYNELYTRYNNDSLWAKTVTFMYLDYGLWLKLTPYDFLNIDAFLDKQISYLKNSNVFDELKFYNGGELDEVKIGRYRNYSIYASKNTNSTWYETNLNMALTLYDTDNYTNYELPMIHYEIDKENDEYICYIYAVQNPKYRSHNKKMERSLYELNNDVYEKPKVHPSFVLAMITFIDMLESREIYKIRIPLLQVLNYGYHVILGEKKKENFMYEWSDEDIKEYNDLNELEKYNKDKKVLDNDNEEDCISQRKIENLSNLIFRIQERYNNIDIDVDDYILDVKIKEKVMIK